VGSGASCTALRSLRAKSRHSEFNFRSQKSSVKPTIFSYIEPLFLERSAQSPGRQSKLSLEQKEELRRLVEAGADLEKDGVAAGAMGLSSGFLANALASICPR
jgi:hypothetical protein